MIFSRKWLVAIAHADEPLRLDLPIYALEVLPVTGQTIERRKYAILGLACSPPLLFVEFGIVVIISNNLKWPE
jgi:hypothetical protein